MIDIRSAGSIAQATRLGLFPAQSEPARQALYTAALTELDLGIANYQLVRDLLCLAGIAPDAALEAGLLALMVAREEGSLCQRLDVGALAARLPTFDGRDGLAQEFIEQLAAGTYDETLVGRSESDFRPLLVRGDYLYFQRDLRDEQLLRAAYSGLLVPFAAPSTDELSRLRTIVVEVLAAPPTREGAAPQQLNAEQQLALALALLRKFAIVTGGPGTGKTFLVLALLRCLVRLGNDVSRIAISAPTGRASHRMTESLRAGLGRLERPTPEEERLTNLSGQTLHRLLAYSPSRHKFGHDRDNPLDVDTVIVDEVSMIDANLMAQLLDAIPTTARLVLLGDVHQLPSVEAGAVLADLVPPGRNPLYSSRMLAAAQAVLPLSPKVEINDSSPSLLVDCVARLERDYRSAPEIQVVADVINNFDAHSDDDLLALLARENTVCSLDQHGLAGAPWQATLKGWAGRHFAVEPFVQAVQDFRVATQTYIDYDDRLREIMEQLGGARILTLIHDGPRGCDGINEYLAAQLRPTLDPGQHGRYFCGAPIMVTRNDYGLELFNGDIGVVLRDAGGGRRAVFPRGERALVVPLDTLPTHTLAFAITVHKSQGGEYDDVLLVLPTASESSRAARLLTREIIYTAVTRARRQICIHGSAQVLVEACRRRVERDSGLEL